MPNRTLSRVASAWLILTAFTAVVATNGGAATVTVTSEPPDAAVYVDGQFAGRTPLTLARVVAGDHRVRVVKDGYLEHGRILTVTAGRPASLQLRLTATSADAARRDQTGGGISSGPPPGSSKRKWWYLAAGGGAAAATALALAIRNSPPTVGTLSASPPVGVVAATSIAFSAPSARDPDSDVLSYSWDFGDGGMAKEQAPHHVYSSAGSFSVKCTVSDGDHSDSASTIVAVRDLTATWTGVLQGIPETVVLTQSGGALSGRFSDATYGTGSLSGFVSTSSPLVRFIVVQPGINPFTFTADPNADVSMLAGVVNGSGFIDERFTITRQ
jgi:hypothetical protein